MLRFIAACAVALACLSPAAAQDKRVALVIGNAAYANVAPMKTALNDASDIGAALGADGIFGDASSPTRRREIHEQGARQIFARQGEDSRRRAGVLRRACDRARRRELADPGRRQARYDCQRDGVGGEAGSRSSGRWSTSRQIRRCACGRCARRIRFPPRKASDSPTLRRPDAGAAEGHADRLFATSAGSEDRSTERGATRRFTAALLKHIETPGLEITC